MINGVESKISSSNVITSLVEMMNLSYSTLRENEENLMESLSGLCYLLIHIFYLSMCMLK